MSVEEFEARADHFLRSTQHPTLGRWRGEWAIAWLRRPTNASAPGKVFVDWGQNDRHKSTVAAYSLRAKLARPTVSLPVTWAELAEAVDAGSGDSLLPSPGDALDRVAQSGDLFAPVLSLAQRLPG